MRKRWSRIGKIAAGIAATALFVTACGGNGPSDSTGGNATAAPTDGVLRLGVLNDIGQPPDPDIYYSGNGLAITTNTYEGLVRYEPGNHDEATIVPLLAESWEINDNFTEYTLDLKEGVVFHDGTPFDAEAVGASFQRRTDVDAGPAYFVAGVDEVRVEDSHRVTVVLNEPNSAFLDYLASPYGPKMISPTVLTEQAGNDFAKSYIATHSAGTGPYELTKAAVGEGYRLEYFSDYWGDLDPDFTTVELPVYTEISAMQLELEQGGLHALLVNVPSSSKQGYLDSDQLKAYSLPSFQVGVSYMNPHRPALSTPESRLDFFEGVDWSTISAQIVQYGYEDSQGNYPKGALSADVDQRPLVYREEALADFAASLDPGQEVRIGHTAGSTDAEQSANVIAANLQALSVNAVVTSHLSSEVFGDFAANPENAPDVFLLTNTWPDSNSPYLHGFVFWAEKGGLNHLQCVAPGIEEKLDEAVATDSEALYAEAGQMAYDYGCSPIYSWSSDFVVAQPWLGAVEDSHSIAAPATLNFATLTIE